MLMIGSMPIHLSSQSAIGVPSFARWTGRPCSIAPPCIATCPLRRRIRTHTQRLVFDTCGIRSQASIRSSRAPLSVAGKRARPSSR